jgi:hypothetical protein
MDELSRVLINAGLPVKEKVILNENNKPTKKIKESPKTVFKKGDRVLTNVGPGIIIADAVAPHIEPVIRLDKRHGNNGNTFRLTPLKKLGSDEISEENTPEYYAMMLEKFMNETAGVGVNAEFNTYPYTPDIKKGTLKATGKKLGFDITDAGIPPNISKDSAIKSKK